MRSILIGLMTAMAVPGAAVHAQPPAATAASPASVAGATKFIDGVAQETFAVLRDKSMTKPAMRTKFRSMLSQHVALDDIGGRLIRRHRAQATPAQLAAYRTALPDFIINAYADRLIDFSAATVKTVRAAPRGTRGDVDVFTRITRPGSAPFEATWTVKPQGGTYKLANLTVSGINVALTQEADFSSYIQKNGFDGLIAFMKSSNAKGAV